MDDSRNYIQRSFGKPVLIARIPWNLFILDVLVSFLVFQYESKLAGFGLGIAIWFVSWRLFVLDPHPIRAFRLWWQSGRHSYDAGNRTFFQTRENLWSQYGTIAKRFFARVTSAN